MSLSALEKRIGTPGSRRFQRFMNHSFLLDQQYQLQQQLDLDEQPNSSSLFSNLFEPENWNTWQDFVDQTEEEQKEVLTTPKRNSTPAKSIPTRRYKSESAHDGSGSSVENGASALTSSQEGYKRIDKYFRTTLRRIYTWDLVQTLDTQLMQFCKDMTSTKLTFKFENPFDRLILHALCQYYGLSHDSITDTLSGDRVLHVSKRRQESRTHDVIPSETLISFLSVNSNVD